MNDRLQTLYNPAEALAAHGKHSKPNQARQGAQKPTERKLGHNFFYADLEGEVERLYLQGVPVRVIAEAFGVSAGSLAVRVSEWGLPAVKELRDADLAKEAARRFKPPERRSQAQKLLDNISDEWVSVQDLRRKSALKWRSISNYLTRFANEGQLERRYPSGRRGRAQQYRRIRARRAA